MGVITQLDEKDANFRRFMIKYAIVASASAWVLGSTIKDFVILLVDSLADPFFTIDINKDGKSDLKQLDDYFLNLLGLKFPLGKLIHGIIRIIIMIIILYFMISFLLYSTDLIIDRHTK